MKSTTSAYQEPVNFKGTKGEWGIFPAADGNRYITVTNGNDVACIYGEEKLRSFNEVNYNTELIAQAKELAKATADLIALAETLQSEVSGLSADTEYENSQPYDAWQSRIQSAKQTLIKAGLKQ